MKYVLSIDQSTSATKAVLFDDAGRILDKASREHRQIYPHPGWVEHDAVEIWQNVRSVLAELTERQQERVDNVAALSITNQRETIVVFDRQTGKPLANAVVWQDRRGDEICAQLRAVGHEESVRAKTGLKLDTYFSASKLKWLIRQRPDIRQKLTSGEAFIGTIDTYLLYRLSDGKVFATDHTNASRTLLYDIGKLRWDDELCNLFDVPMQALPEVRESFAEFGATSSTAGLSRSLSIRGVMGDSQASLFAQRCYQPGTAKATFGTGTSVLVNIGGEPRVSKLGAVSALAWVLNGRPSYALEGLINYSSATISWLKDQLGLIDSAAQTESLARSVSNTDGVYLVPAFAGLSAPYWSPEARAAIVGMTSFTRTEHIVRAALESIAYQIRDVLEMISEDARATPKIVHADGGPTRNEFLMQLVADITRLELVVADVAESSALGAAMAGMLGSRLVRSLDELARTPRETRCYRPQMAAEEADRLYAGWKAAVKRVL